MSFGWPAVSSGLNTGAADGATAAAAAAALSPVLWLPASGEAHEVEADEEEELVAVDVLLSPLLLLGALASPDGTGTIITGRSAGGDSG